MDKEKLKQKIMDKVEIDPVTGCWNWVGKYRRNKPSISISADMEPARRVCFETFLGDVFDSSIAVTVSCNNDKCICPEHLILKNKSSIGMEQAKLKFSAITTCKNGHPKSEFVPDHRGNRICHQCCIDRSKKRRMERRACKNGHLFAHSIIQSNGTRRCKKCVDEGVFNRRWDNKQLSGRK